MLFVDNVAFSTTHCTFLLTGSPNLELFPHTFPLTRVEVRKKLRVTSQANAQCVDHGRVYVHPPVYNAITDWLVDE